MSGNYLLIFYPQTQNISMNNTMDRQFITKFVEKYRSLPALWKVKSDEYKNKGLKQVSYLDLLLVTKQYYPEADVEFCKRKINNLRTAFRKEYRKYHMSLKNGINTYIPSLWYYDMLYFTADQETDPLEDDDNDYFNGNISVTQSLEIDESPQYDSHDSEPVTRIFERPRKRPAEEPIYLEVPQSRKTENDYVRSGKDHYDAFGTYIAEKLRSMENQQRLYAEHVINQALFHGSIQELSSSSTVTTPHIPHQIPVNHVSNVTSNETVVKTEQLD